MFWGVQNHHLMFSQARGTLPVVLPLSFQTTNTGGDAPLPACPGAIINNIRNTRFKLEFLALRLCDPPALQS